jgi:hypothetical protein
MENTYNLATQLLDGEITNFEHDPVEWIKSLWPDRKDIQDKAKEVDWDIAPTKEEYQQLQAVIEGLIQENEDIETLDICEHDRVNGHMVNYLVFKIVEVLGN